MSQYQSIKAITDAFIKANGRREITGHVLNAVLNAVIESLGKYYQFVGVAVPSTDPGTPDQNVAYLAGTSGSYTNMGYQDLASGEIAVIKYDGTWVKETVFTVPAPPTKVSELENDAEYITSLVSDLVYYYDKDSVDQLLQGKQDTISINEEDLEMDQDSGLRFANRVNGVNTTGKGYVILRGDKPFADQVAEEDTIYEIRDDFDLDNESITIPAGSVLKFNGGKLNNGTITMNGAAIIATGFVFDNVTFADTYTGRVDVRWFGVSPSGSSNSAKLNAIFGFCEDIFFPTGNYNCESALAVNSDSAIVSIIGQMADSKVRLNFNGTDGIVIKKKIVLENLEFYGTNAVGTYDPVIMAYAGGNIGIDVQKGCTIRKVNVSSFMVGINIVSGNVIAGAFSGLTIRYCGNYGLYLVSASDAQKNNLAFDQVYIALTGYEASNYTSDSTLEKSGIGAFIKGGQGNKFSSFVCEYNSGVGLIVDGQTTGYILSGNSFNAFYLERNKYANCIYNVPTSSQNKNNGNVFTAFFFTEAGYSVVSNGNANRQMILRTKLLDIATTFITDATADRDIAEIIKDKERISLDDLSPLGLTEDSSYVIESDSDGYFLQMDATHYTLTDIGMLRLLTLPRGVYNVQFFAQKQDTGTNPQLFVGFAINGTAKTFSRQLNNGKTAANLVYLPNDFNVISVTNSYITNTGSLPDGWSAKIRALHYARVTSITSDQRSGLSLDSAIKGWTVFDETLGKCVVWSGSAWLNVDGTAL